MMKKVLRSIKQVEFRRSYQAWEQLQRIFTFDHRSCWFIESIMSLDAAYH